MCILIPFQLQPCCEMFTILNITEVNSVCNKPLQKIAFRSQDTLEASVTTSLLLEFSQIRFLKQDVKSSGF